MTRSDELEDIGGACLLLKANTAPTDRKKLKNKIDDVFVNEVIKCVCALLNTQGGKLKIEYCESLDITEKAHKDFVRKVEQHVHEMSNYSTIRQMSIEICYPRYDLFYIRPSSTLCTISYNICAPTETQILSLPSTEPCSNIYEILRGKYSPEKPTVNGSHHKEFVLGTQVSSELRESKTVQVKVIKAQPSKCLSLADRIINRSNKFINLVSAFANFRGGHLYIGIDSLTYQVEGIHVTKLEKYRICNHIRKALNKMIWPVGLSEKETLPKRPLTKQLPAVSEKELPERESEEDLQLDNSIPKRGIHWDIYFEPVVNSEGHQIPDTYIIVVYIARTPGGVFCEEPESYYVQDGDVERMHFEDWKQKLMFSVVTDFQSKNERIEEPQFLKTFNGISAVPPLEQLSRRLQRLRKDGEWNAFDMFASKASTSKDPSVLAVLAYERTLAAITKQEHEKASKNFEDFCKSVSKNFEEPSCYEMTKTAYLKSSLFYSKGKYEESYYTLKRNLEEAEKCPAWTTTVSYYSLLASVAAICSAVDLEDQSIYSEESIKYNEEALKIWENVMLDNTRAPHLNDSCQVIYINMAFAYLCSSIKGVNERQTVEISNVEKAWCNLTLAQRPCVGARAMSKYNECIYLLAESDVHYRLSQVYPLHKFVHIESAVTIATRARDIARSNTFLQLLDHCLARLAFLTEQLMREKMKDVKQPSEQENILKALSLNVGPINYS